MRLTHTLALVLASAAFVGLPATGCGGSVEPGNGGYPGVGNSSGSSSGVTTSSSSGTTASSGSASGGPTTSPQCVGLPVPAIAEVCPDGSSAGAYYVWDGTQCVLAYSCPSTPGQTLPPGPGPTPSPCPPGAFCGPPTSSSSSSSSGGVTGTPPTCNFALPNICQACSNGETICAHYAIQNGMCVVEICPPAYVPPPSPPVGGSCSQGAPCVQGEGCGSSGGSGCSTSCTCDYTGYFQCSTTCGPYYPPPPPPPPPPPYMGCSQGAPCTYGTGCGTTPDSYGCYTSCTCDYYGTMQCSYLCGGIGGSSSGGFPAVDAGVVD